MANSDIAYGLRPYSYLSGAPYNGQARLYYVPSTDATALFLGTPVKLAGSADTEGVADVTAASINDNVVGVVVGVKAVTEASLIYRAASTERYVYVADDPNILFSIQEDAVGGALAVASTGLNADWVGSGGSTDTGWSSIELDSNTAAATATLDFLIMGFVRRADNEAAVANADVIVKLQNHQYADGAVGL
jgi:hypothetical protein